MIAMTHSLLIARVCSLQLKYMRQHGLLDNQHHRKASEVSKYVEALVRNGISLKSSNKKDAKAAEAK